MTDKQAVLDALQRLPENVSLKEITEELRIMASVRRGRADIAAGRIKTQEEAERLPESWATAWTSER
jgi:predicted transcriptional regulator